ncbi:hypothetical protein PIB30_012373 [Stylosanthes scabra]|uniref:FAR1 domain-containing protein n=1 Tax=Stylosanthes scabra TaxID=79078 RepID=A0ABU6Q5Z1_9FABA|nr:hypothetical protein [Stylosanthes scabra]
MHEATQFEEEMQDLNSIHEEGHLEEEMQFLCNVDEKFVPKVGMTFKSCTEANEFYKEYTKRAGFSSKIGNSQRNKEIGAIKTNFRKSI